MSKILSLDGDWQMIWDTEDAGISNRWYATYPKDIYRWNLARQRTARYP